MKQINSIKNREAMDMNEPDLVNGGVIPFKGPQKRINPKEGMKTIKVGNAKVLVFQKSAKIVSADYYYSGNSIMQISPICKQLQTGGQRTISHVPHPATMSP